jgi:hypothetical protein
VYKTKYSKIKYVVVRSKIWYYCGIDTIRSSGLHSSFRVLNKRNRERTDQDPSYFYSTLWMKNEGRRILLYLSRNTLPDTISSCPDTEAFSYSTSFRQDFTIISGWRAWAKFSRRNFPDPAKIPDFYPPGPPKASTLLLATGISPPTKQVEVTTRVVTSTSLVRGSSPVVSSISRSGGLAGKNLGFSRDLENPVAEISLTLVSPIRW